MNFNSPELPELFLPPVNRSMRELDRSFFQKSVSVTAARITDFKSIKSIRDTLSRCRDVLNLTTLKTLFDMPNDPGAKYLLLQPDVKVDGNFSNAIYLTDSGQLTLSQMTVLGLKSCEDLFTMAVSSYARTSCT